MEAAPGQDSGVETECDQESNDSSLSNASVPQPPPPLIPSLTLTATTTTTTTTTATLGGVTPSNSSTDFLAPMSSESSAPPSASATPEPSPAVPQSVTEDGYLGDCSSDGGNEKNFPMPPERFSKAASSSSPSCSCHPDAAPEAPAGLMFQHIKPDLLSNGYQAASLPPSSSSSAAASSAANSTSRKMRSFYRGHHRLHSNNWIAMKSGLAERKLRAAASMNNVELAERLLGSGVNVNAYDEHRRTGLHIAAAKGFAEVVGMLLRNGANPNQKDALGNTALHLAACTNHIEVVTALLRAGTNVATLDNNGRTPIQLAQSKLKLLQKTSSGGHEMAKVKKEVAHVLEMMREYLTKTGCVNEYDDLLNTFSYRFNLHQTPDQVNSDLQNLLDSLGNLSLQKSS